MMDFLDVIHKVYMAGFKAGQSHTTPSKETIQRLTRSESAILILIAIDVLVGAYLFFKHWSL